MMLETDDINDDTNKVVQAYLAEHPEIVTEGLPSYAPETNPDESVWQYTKYSRLSIFALRIPRSCGRRWLRNSIACIALPTSWWNSSAMPESPSGYSGCLVSSAGTSHSPRMPTRNHSARR